MSTIRKIDFVTVMMMFVAFDDNRNIQYVVQSLAEVKAAAAVLLRKMVTFFRTGEAKNAVAHFLVRCESMEFGKGG